MPSGGIAAKPEKLPVPLLHFQPNVFQRTRRQLLMKLKPSELWLLHCIRRNPTATIDQLCIDSNFCRRTLFAAIKRLEEAGSLIVERTSGGANKYKIMAETEKVES